jgi:RNA polymerase sigma-70 factor (ECF subfamily)
MGDRDADLVQRWRRGDVAAFEDLVRRWQQPVARVVARLVGRSGGVQDLCQEVFLRVFLARDRYREAGTFGAWVYRIAVNAVRDAARRQRHRPEPLADREPAAQQPGPAFVCEQREMADLLARAVAELPPPLREVLVLRHYEGLGFEEIGRVLDTPATTLKSRFAVALDRLRDRLRALDSQPEETDA